jgi:hypothetical protein
MILTLLWKWLRDLWRDAHPIPAPDGEAALDVHSRSDDRSDGPQPAA